MKARQNSAFLAVSMVCTALGWAVAPNAQATVFPLVHSTDSVFGEDQTVITVYEDTLYDLARNYSLGSEELIRVNPGIDPWLPGAGKQVTIPGRHILPPGPHEGIVVNLAGASALLLPEAEARRAPGSHHLSSEHRQDGLAHAARPDACHRQAKGSDLVPPGLGAQGARRQRGSFAGLRAAGT